MASKKVLQNRINKFIEKMALDPVIYPHLEIVDDNLDKEDDPSIWVRSDYQTIVVATLSDAGDVGIRTANMRKGAGSKKDFDKKIEALEILRKYVKKKYKGYDFVVKESLDNIKVTAIDKIFTLTVDSKSKEIIIKERARRGTKTKDAAAEPKPAGEPKAITKPAKDPQPKEPAGKEPVVEETIAETPKKTFELKSSKRVDPEDIVMAEDFNKPKEYPFLPEGTIIRNICNDKKYKVIHDSGNVIEVFDSQHGYLIMARADVKVVQKKEGNEHDQNDI